MKLLVTGAAGFIGSTFVKHALVERLDWEIISLDSLTYAGNLENLSSVLHHSRHQFVKGDIGIEGPRVIRQGVDGIINFAAESHVDRSLLGSDAFVKSNVHGVARLLDAIKDIHGIKFLQVSTDEVYGSLPPEGFFTESTPLHPNNPYASTKAAADLLVLAYAHTFGIDAVITRSSNNYGPYQFPEKFIPLFISNAMEAKRCPVYGDGMQIRDWLHVKDNCAGILAALEKGKKGEVYNLGGGNERPNLDVAKLLLRLCVAPESLLEYVKDRLGHDRRYAIDCSKAKAELGWRPEVEFGEGIQETVRWYLSNPGWVARVKSGEYRAYYHKQYGTDA